MLSMLELFINGFVAVVVLPMAIVSLATGSKPPEHSFVGKFYRAEPRLMLAGNVLLLAVGATALSKLAQHFGWVGAELGEKLDIWISMPLMVMVVIVLFLMKRAIMRVRRTEKAG
jgi:hypothetical protein